MVDDYIPECDGGWSDTPLPPGFYPKYKLNPIIFTIKIIGIVYVIKKLIIDKF